MAVKMTTSLLGLLFFVASLTCVTATDTTLGTGENCVTATDTAGGPKCKASQIALCCNGDPTQVSENCVSASGSSCASEDQRYNPYCCDQMDNPGCGHVNSGCEVQSHPVPTRYCCAREGNVTRNLGDIGDRMNSHGGLDCENLYNMPFCPSNRPLSFCC